MTKPKQPSPKAPGLNTENRFGVDVDYFKGELSRLAKSLPNRPGEELARYLRVLANVADPVAPKPPKRRRPFQVCEFHRKRGEELKCEKQMAELCEFGPSRKRPKSPSKATKGRDAVSYIERSGLVELQKKHNRALSEGMEKLMAKATKGKRAKK